MLATAAQTELPSIAEDAAGGEVTCYALTSLCKTPRSYCLIGSSSLSLVTQKVEVDDVGK